MHILYLGDCIEVMRGLPADSVDCVVTDPPYELGFMGKGWDASGIAYSVPMWREVWRVLKPGGYLLSFSSPRTYHRMVCGIEDAGFEIRDQIMWVFGSGFPKSLDISKAIDKQAGAERGIIGENKNYGTTKAVDGKTVFGDYAGTWDITAPATPEAQQWDGWGTALKPAHEPICVARKPLGKGLTVADNVLQFGTGGINIDGCRIAGEKMAPNTGSGGLPRRNVEEQRGAGLVTQPHDAGRWPANLIHDGSDYVLALFPETTSGARNGKRSNNSAGIGTFHEKERDTGKQFAADSGSAARFFYCAKASKKDRDEGLTGPKVPASEMTGGRKEGSAGLNCPRAGAGRTEGGKNSHPTVKPTELMRYLVRLVCPPGGVVLDPFNGSGSTGKACALEGLSYIGIDQEAEYLKISHGRISAITPCTIIAGGAAVSIDVFNLLY